VSIKPTFKNVCYSSNLQSGISQMQLQNSLEQYQKIPRNP